MITKPVNSVDHVFRAVADPTRLRLLNLLRGGERCVCELVDSLRIPQPKASRHLAYLRRAGFVSVRKDGLWAYYKLAPARNDFQAKLLDCLATCCNEVPVMNRDKRRITQNGKCC
jgi:ArsR family transcriptional regulator, arsenate/arsenite/antimonite-responsive transcriptional repressor